MNTQQPEKISHSFDGSVLDVHSIFSTIQGEGPYSGQRAIFIRLAGCNLQCPLCDTDYTEGRFEKQVNQLVKDVVEVGGKSQLVVITGGEPFRQNITQLANLLLSEGYRVQVETNGTVYLENFPYNQVTIVCSPKTPNLHPKLVDYIDHYKYVVMKGKVDSDYLPINVLGLEYAKPISKPVEDKPVYIQPCDSKDQVENKSNLDICIKAVMEMGYTLNLQVHKIIEVE